jgi:hypothetical protein
MPSDLSDAIRTIEHVFSGLSPALVAVVLLGGPTALWLLYRFVVQPRTSRYVNGALDPFWVCENCRSANAFSRSNCYRCGFEPTAHHDLEVLVGDPADPEIEVSPGIPVGPGRRPVIGVGVAAAYQDPYAGTFAYADDDAADDGEEAYETEEREDVAAGAEGMGGPGVAVGPGRPAGPVAPTQPAAPAQAAPTQPVAANQPTATRPRRSVVAGTRADLPNE